MNKEDLLKQVEEYFPKLTWTLNEYATRSLIESTFYFYTIHIVISNNKSVKVYAEINPLSSTNIVIQANTPEELLHKIYEHLAQKINEARGMINK